ncbi:MAG: sodium:solute symporter [Pirellulaceae bacterium]
MNIAIGGMDLLVLGVYLAGVVALGLWVGRGQRDLNSYLLGGRDLPWWAILGSLVATETSTATFLSVPGLAFAKTTGDMRFLQLTLGYIVGRLLITIVLLPWFFRGPMYTAYEVLEHRFGGATKQVASLVFLVARNLGDGLRLYLTAIALEQVTGFSLPFCVVLIGAATIVYTVFGGMKSVVWNDCVQFVVYMMGGLLAGMVILYRLPGGWSEFVEFGTSHAKFRIFDFHWDLSEPYTFWAGIIGGMFLTLGTHGTDQMMVQRYLCARSQRDAGRALMASGFVVMLQFALFLLLGVGLACFYDRFYPDTTFASNDHVFATFIVGELPFNVGLIGLLLAAVFAAAMSTLSSSLNSSASAAVNDFYATWWKKPPSQKHLLGASRVLTIVFGVVQITIGIAAMRSKGSVVADALAIASFSAGLLLGLFFLGIFTKHVDQTSAFVGLLFGLAVLLAAKFVAPVYNVSFGWPWFALIGAVATFSAGFGASLLMGRCHLGVRAL